MYQPIDQVRTGVKLKITLHMAGYDVKYIQEYLHLSYPQCIYRWFKGMILPSVEHLCALSKLLGVHMEDLLVLEGQPMFYGMDVVVNDPKAKRLLSYTRYLQDVA